VITIEKGTTLTSLASVFKEKHLVNSSLLFKILVSSMGGERSIESGEYLFPRPIGLYEVANRIVHKDHGITVVKITIPEGLNSKQITTLIGSTFSHIDATALQGRAASKEGYLFPDTYFFASTITTDSILQKMNDNFVQKTAGFETLAKSNGHSFSDIIIMASILEKEARTPESRAVISGILWKRISIGMPLQVDATLGYVTGRGSKDLTVDDLKLESGYNTYIHKGLPAGPISNPGLDAIYAALHPTLTNYLYYLSDSSGEMHYSVTFEQHKANKLRFLR
jgi:UPF0755 protein